MSNKKVKILLIEDNPGDARLIKEMLAEAPDVSFELKSANRLSTGLERLAKETPDVILLDIGLPDSQGLTTLKKVYAKAKTVPIVVLTGLEDESVGMEAVQQGAQDYLVKGQIQSKVLWRVVNYSIERKRAGEMLRQSEERYRTVLEEMGDSYFETDLAGNFTVVNDATCHALGCPREKIIGTSYRTFVVKEHIDAVYQAFNQVYRTGTPIRQFSYEVLGKDGATRFVEVSILLLRDKEGQIVGFRGLGRDITERKKAEEALQESRETLRKTFESVTDGISVIDLNGVIIETNQSTVEMHGFSSKDEVLGKSALVLIAPGDRAKVVKNMRQAIKQGVLRGVEYNLLRTDGSEFFGELSTSVLKDASGNTVAHVSIARDITERKQAEEALRQSEEKYRTILKEMEDGYFEVDLAGNITFANDATCRSLGYSREELPGMNYRRFTAEEDIERLYQVFSEVYRTGEPNRDLLWKIARKDGSIRFADVVVSLLRSQGGEIIGFRGVGRDITERKQAEEALAEEAIRRRILIEQSSDGIVVLDGSGKVYEANKRFADMLGYSPEEARELHMWDWDTQWTREQLLEMARTDDATGRHFETSHRRKDGTVFDVEISTNGAVVAGQKLVFCVCRDITERKRMERELRSSRDQLDRILNSMVEVLVVMDTDYNIIDVNRSFLGYYGGKREDIIGRKCYEVLYRLSKPCSTARRRCPLKTVLKTGKPFNGEGTRKTAEGQELIFEETMFPLVDAAGNIEALIEMQHDITVRKQMEESLRLSEQNFRDTMENSPLGIRILDKGGKKTLYANRAVLDMWGYSSLEELEAVPAKQRYTPESYAEHLKRLKRRERGKTAPMSYELSIVRGDGQVRHISASRGELLWGGEERFQVVYQDITERKQAEAEYRTIIRAAMDCFWLTDMQGNFLDVNEAYCRLVGYSRDELLNMSIKDIEEIEKPEDIAERIRKIEEVGYDRFETRHRRKDGGIVDVEISVNYLSTGGGRMFIFLRDITERKRMEEELRQNVERFKKAMEGVIQLIATIVEVRDPYTAGHQRRVAELACAIAKEMGFSEERIEEIRMASLIHDIGKIYVPAEILSKPSRLTEIEFSMIKSHPQVAYDILKSVEFPWPICKVVLQHHERMDSSGYPGGLPGEDILPGARIMAVADVVEAMASHRPYRPALGLDKALEEISQKRGILYDTEAVDACLRVFSERGFKL